MPAPTLAQAPTPPPLSGDGGPPPTQPSSRGGPKTPEGKAVSSRNATSHGLFARHAVLPHLGEDPAQYETLLRHLFDQVRPRNLLERQYIELWAEASWKLRRLARLEADLWDDDALTTAERLAQLERLDRLQSSLRRKMDKAVHMLGPDLPRLFAQRTREDLMDHLGLTPSLCAGHPYRERDLEDAVRAHRTYPDPTLIDPLLADPDPTDLPAVEATPAAETPQNEPLAADPAGAHHKSPNSADAPTPPKATPGHKKRENELPVSTMPLNNSFTVRHRHPSPALAEGFALLGNQTRRASGEGLRGGGGTPPKSP